MYFVILPPSLKICIYVKAKYLWETEIRINFTISNILQNHSSLKVLKYSKFTSENLKKKTLNLKSS